MKKILSPGLKVTSRYMVTCPICECQFEYEGLDILMSNNGSTYVSCPNCLNSINHSRSNAILIQRSNLSQESF